MLKRPGVLALIMVLGSLLSCGGGSGGGGETEPTSPAAEGARACENLRPAIWNGEQRCEALAASSLASADELRTIWREAPQGICEYGITSTIGPGACPGARALGNAYFCPASDEVGWDFFFLDAQAISFGEFASFTIIAHEWGHLLQARSGTNVDPARLPIERELQADCLAGVAAGVAEARGFIAPSDLRDGFEILCEVGDDIPEGFWDPRGHGTCGQRNAAFLLGLSSSRRQLGQVCGEDPISAANAICDLINLPPVSPPVTPPEPPPTAPTTTEVFVSARLADQRTGVLLSTGQRFSIRASGLASGFENAPADPGGTGFPTDEDFMGSPYPVPGVGKGALVGRIGNGPYFLIGAEFDGVADRNGELLLMINDAFGFLGNNSGGFDVAITLSTLG